MMPCIWAALSAGFYLLTAEASAPPLDGPVVPEQVGLLELRHFTGRSGDATIHLHHAQVALHVVEGTPHLTSPLFLYGARTTTAGVETNGESPMTQFVVAVLHLTDHGLGKAAALYYPSMGTYDRSIYTLASSAHKLISQDQVHPWLAEQVSTYLGRNERSINYNKRYVKHNAAYETEIKINVHGRQGSLWNLCQTLMGLIGSGSLPPFAPEVGDEFQQWHRYTRMFEVSAPAEEQGYVAIVTSKGDTTCGVKRKVFTEDTLHRQESFLGPIDRASVLPAEFIRQRIPGADIVEYPEYERVRFDINLESLRSGNLYGIMFDHVSLRDGPEELRQIEIEYLRSRPAALPDQAERIAEEMQQLVSLVGEHLHERQMPHEVTFYSKLSFVRDVAAERQHVL